ncbi:MAG TPA: coproporphyrinogen III oxidase [Rikenellaceae bacterium]|nr:coproporphyrinogen III oxidase [Rikenellaceae bacterium]
MISVHVPFCRSFCTYCDFYSEIACRGRDAEAIGNYSDDICAEIDSRREEMEKTLGINTLYIGGGTPSVLPLCVLERIVRRIDCGPYEELTVEVNPEDIVSGGVHYAEGLVRLGVTRVSMGVQSMDEAVLRRMNRRHDAQSVWTAVSVLRRAGLDNISLDLIFGGLGVDESNLEHTLDDFLDMAPEHISAYQLSVEEGSVLAEMVLRGDYHELPDEECRHQYDLICRRLADAGYIHYEISNWCKPGFRAKHNSAYWKRVPYVGFGPGAHSFDGEHRSWNTSMRSGWSPESETLTSEQAREEIVMLALRTSEGVDPSLCEHTAVERLLGQGLLELIPHSRNVRIPERAFFVSDSIVEMLV